MLAEITLSKSHNNYQESRVVVLGLGYVGLPLAVALGKRYDVLGVDIDDGRVAELRSGYDRTREVSEEALKASSLTYTSSIEDSRGAGIYIVTVPTPVDQANQPDLRPVLSATRSLANVLDATEKPIIVYESTVYPGVTEDICGPEIERISGLRRGTDFFLGYSPERINPGDREHTVDRITKVVAGENADVLEALCEMYGAATSGGTFRAASIKAAEAAKVIENAQRDINIAFMNEITQIFSRMDLSIYDVLDAAGTKWNFLKFSPGLVGGHCIGVDPYYLSYKAQQLGHDPQVILSGRAINNSMGQWIADEVHSRLDGKRCEVLVLGLTFKEDVPDLRNARVVDVIRRLEWLGHKVSVHDPLANPEEAMHEYGISLDSNAFSRTYDAIVAAVPHREYKAMGIEKVAKIVTGGGLIADVKGMWRGEGTPAGVNRWAM